MKLSDAQERMLLELAEPNDNPDNEWRIGGRQIATAESLVRFGLARRHDGLGSYQSGREFSLTAAGKARARELKRSNERQAAE